MNSTPLFKTKKQTRKRKQVKQLGHPFKTLCVAIETSRGWRTVQLWKPFSGQLMSGCLWPHGFTFLMASSGLVLGVPEP